MIYVDTFSNNRNSGLTYTASKHTTHIKRTIEEKRFDLFKHDCFIILQHNSHGNRHCYNDRFLCTMCAQGRSDVAVLTSGMLTVCTIERVNQEGAGLSVM